MARILAVLALLSAACVAVGWRGEMVVGLLFCSLSSISVSSVSTMSVSDIPLPACLFVCCRQNLPIKHIPGPEGVRGRNSDNELILEKLGWGPTVSLRDGLRLTYFWIKAQIEGEIAQRGADAAQAYAHSTVVKTGAPTELGTLRKADGDEGFDAAKKAAVQVAA